MRVVSIKLYSPGFIEALPMFFKDFNLEKKLVINFHELSFGDHVIYKPNYHTEEKEAIVIAIEEKYILISIEQTKYRTKKVLPCDLFWQGRNI